MQCHLEPTSTAIPSLIRRFNRGPFSFSAGEPLSAFVLIFDHAPGSGRDDKFEIVGSSAYRLRQSRCFIASRNALTCETCHDPHRVPRGEEAVRHYSAVCRQCHAVAMDGLVSKGTASRRNGLRRLPHAEAPDRGRRSRRHDGPPDSAPSAVTQLAGRTRRTSPRGVRRVSRRGGSVLPSTLPRTGPDALYRRSGAGADEEQSSRGRRRTGPPGGRAATARGRVAHSAWRRLACRRRSAQSHCGVRTGNPTETAIGPRPAVAGQGIASRRGSSPGAPKYCGRQSRSILPTPHRGISPLHWLRHWGEPAKQSKKCRRPSRSIRICPESTQPWRGATPLPGKWIAPNRRCGKLSASILTMRPPGIWPAGLGPRNASSPRRSTISKRQCATGPTLRHISMTTR